ncbi:uncharacterized protein F5147DRAFT_841485 [Suillus discolor]|uniref:Uncharacterized protein n=1 Tax=Suillus discolor TaxID=1912936 RepID=A0A9P7ESR2_9AGAM|nr:uncharacterized protein F5147DRAFT_841485 [Suillus discolor]KAG2087202.1 hypothetical protein F5147DRAFT_841485 [Suillus discolor]
MATACSFHGIVGIQNATPYSLDSKKRFWKMEGFVPVSLDPEDSIGDPPVSVFVFGGKTAPPEDGINFVSLLRLSTKRLPCLSHQIRPRSESSRVLMNVFHNNTLHTD